MAGIYDYLKERGQLTDDEPARENWLLAGLIHDTDYGGEFKNEYPLKTKEALARYGLESSDTVLRIVQAHAPELTGRQPKNKTKLRA